MTARRAAAYIRVSTEEQTDGWSYEGQERRIREYADREQYKIVQVYRDETSGSKEKRPGLDQMILDAQAGLFSAIIVLHTSRLFRNVALARRYKELFRNELNIEVLFVEQPITDSDDPMSFVMETFNEMFDEYYLHQLRFWTTLGKQTRAKNGLWNGTLPFGYTSDDDKNPIPHPINSIGLKMAFEAYSTGRYSDGEIAELLNSEGYETTGNWGARRFTKDTVNRILRNAFYLGHVKYKGELLPGQHPALISQDLFDSCQEVRARRRSKSRSIGHKRRVYIMSSLARCSKCDLTLRCGATSSKGKWRYYRHVAKDRGYDCEEPSKGIRADRLEEQWSEIISGIELPSDWKSRIENLVGDADERATILAERERVNERLRRLKEMYRDLVIESDEYRSTLNQLQDKLSSLVLPSSPHLIQAGQYLENIGNLWSQMTLAEQRDITRVVMKSISVSVSGEKIIGIEPLPTFRLLFTEICENIGIKII